MSSLRYFGQQGNGFYSRKWRNKLIAPDKIYKKYHQTPLKEFFEKLCAKYPTAEERRVGLSKQAALKRRMNGTFRRFLNFLARRQRNLLCYIFAEGGEGKSQLALLIKTLISIELKKFHPEWGLKYHYSDSIAKTQDLIDAAADGDTIHQDEDDDVMGIGSKNTLKKLYTLLKRLRKTQKNIIFCSPSMHIYPNVYIALELFGIYEDKKYTRAIIWYFDRGAIETKAYPLGFLEFDVGQVQAEYDSYVVRYKDPSLKNIQTTKGAITPESTVKKWEKLAPAFAKCAKEHGWKTDTPNPSKKALTDVYIGYFKDECEALGTPIAPDTNDLKILAQVTVNYIIKGLEDKQKQQQEQKEGEREQLPASDQFQVDPVFLAQEMQGEKYPDWSTQERDLQIFLLSKNQNKPNTEIAKIVKCSTQTVHDALDRVLKRLDHKFGKSFEKYAKQQVDKLGLYDPATLDGSSGMPDVWAINPKNMTALVVSCKCPSYSPPSKSVPAKEQNPEVKKARELRGTGYKVTCECWLFNRASEHLWKKPININKPACLKFSY